MNQYIDQKKWEKIQKTKKPIRIDCHHEPFIYDSDFIDWLTKGGRED